jgi:alpha-galactosidase
MIKVHKLGSTIAEYFIGDKNTPPGLRIRPAGLKDKSALADDVLPLAQVALRGDVTSAGFAAGVSMCLGETTQSLRWQRQRVTRSKGALTITTTLVGRKGLECEHRLSWRRGTKCLILGLRLVNRGRSPLTVEHVSSFCLGGIKDEEPGRIWRHRIRSGWSSEGQHEVSPLAALQMECSPTGHSVQAERFGQVGSMPVRNFFPFLVLEDRKAGLFFGARLAWLGSWQMETFRRRGSLAISGGLADREMGHWYKTLKPRQEFVTPDAHVAVGAGCALDEFCQILTEPQKSALPGSEKKLPIIFNEFCSTWGRPSEENIRKLVDRLRGTAVKYFVLDAGWYDAIGDWQVKERIYPNGFAASLDYIRRAGMVPGVWFEPEVACMPAGMFTKADWLLKLDGEVIQSGERRFLDLRKREVRKYLDKRVIGLLEKYRLGYVKIDYNEPIGIGCDGAESPGEGLRQVLAETQGFFRRMRGRLPGLLVENCASGGHRLEPSLLALSAMSSFSDAHEVREIPLIAANLHRVMLPRQSQIWAVLREKDTLQRIEYSLAATFLGRMCLSGDVHLLSQRQWALVGEGMRLYQQAAPVIADGVSHIVRHSNGSLRKPDGWQIVTRVNRANNRALVVAHQFAKPFARRIEIALPKGSWRLSGGLALSSLAPDIRGGKLALQLNREFSGGVLLLQRC